MTQNKGASDKSDRATAAEPVVSALRDGIPSAGHTPGPWEQFTTCEVTAADPTGEYDIALVVETYGSPNPEADARLIAAAPDLLKELILLLAAIDMEVDLEPFEAGAKAAIAKARGGA